MYVWGEYGSSAWCNTELVAKPREVTPSREYVEDSAYTIDTSNNIRGGNGLDVSHHSEQAIAKDSVDDVGAFNIQTGVNNTDKQALGLQWVNPADDSEQEGADNAWGEDPTILEWHTLVNRDPLGSENIDILDDTPRLWKSNNWRESKSHG